MINGKTRSVPLNILSSVFPLISSISSKQTKQTMMNFIVSSLFATISVQVCPVLKGFTHLSSKEFPIHINRTNHFQLGGRWVVVFFFSTINEYSVSKQWRPDQTSRTWVITARLFPTKAMLILAAT